MKVFTFLSSTYMKHYFLTILILGVAWNTYSQDQQFSRRRVATEENSATTVSVRAQNMYGNTGINTDNVVWLREIYRELDLKQEKNGPLYFPVEPIDNRINLFTLIFNLLAEGKINAYEYLDGREVFTDQYRVDFKKILNTYGILYEEKFTRSSKNPVYSVHESDIPSNEVLGFYIKEMWYFDQSSSTFDSQITALCPRLFRVGDWGGEAVPHPLFWIAYEDLRPYLSQVQIMTSNYNNVLNSTYNDYFRQRLYKGDIYKTTNLANLALMHYCPTDSLMQLEQKRIENELIAFEKSLWEQDAVSIASLRMKKNLTKSEQDLLRKLEADEKKNEKGKATMTSDEESTIETSSTETNQKETKSVQSKKSSTSKAPKQQTAPKRSVRRQR